MNTTEILGLVLRWLHILAGMTAVGGMVFIRFVMVPSRDAIPAESFKALHDQMRPRWSKIVALAVATLLVSGLINFVLITQTYILPPWYHAVWGVKFLVALVIFFLSSVLAGRTALADRLRQNIRMWLNLNLLLAIAVVMMSGILKSADKVPKHSVPVGQSSSSVAPPKG